MIRHVNNILLGSHNLEAFSNPEITRDIIVTSFGGDPIGEMVYDWWINRDESTT